MQEALPWINFVRKQKIMFALIDCNNFFVSCERCLDETLIGKPVVVLSNNDGCVISRSDEAKQLGIPMGAPYFQYKKMMERNGVKVLSAKFEIYNHKSQQVSDIISRLVPDCEIYSIDEVFLDLNSYRRFFDLHEICLNIREEILLKTKIPTGIGIAPTKTLAKVANRIAKKFPAEFGGIYQMEGAEKIEKALKWLAIEDVWGIGRRLAVKMQDSGVRTAFDLLQKPEPWVRSVMGIHGIRMVRELRGERQLELDDPAKKKSIATTRSFMEMISEPEELAERIKTFAFICAEKLRRQNSCCREITVFIKTNRFRPELGVYQNGRTLRLNNPTNSAITLAKAAGEIFSEIFAEGFMYKKAGVIVSDFVPENERITSLFEQDWEEVHRPVMKAMDRMNNKYGKQKVRLGSQSGKSPYNRKIFSEEYENFLKNNTLNEAAYRFH